MAADPIDPARVREAVERFSALGMGGVLPGDIDTICTAALDSLTQRDTVQELSEAMAGLKSERDKLQWWFKTLSDAVESTDRQRDQLRSELERAKLTADVASRAEITADARIDGLNLQLTAAKQRAKEHRRQLRQMNKAIERYRASYVEQVHRTGLEKEHATLRARAFDTRHHQVLENWGIAEARKRTLEHENAKLQRELEAARAEHREYAARLFEQALERQKQFISERDEAREQLSTAQADAQRLRELLGPGDCDADPVEPPECRRCGSGMHIPNGFEPTPECDPCAQELLRAARAALEGRGEKS